MTISRKYRNVQADPRVSFVVDDRVPDEPGEFKPGVGRGVEISGRAEALAGQEPPALARPGFFSPEIIRIYPDRVLSWHIDPERPVLRVLRSR